MSNVNYPTFDARGGINMSDVMYAPFWKFEDDGLDVLGFLEEIYIGLTSRSLAKLYKNAVSDVAHAALEKYRTPEGKARKPGYTLPAMYCLAYRAYVFLTDTSGLRSSDSDEFVLTCSQAMVKCEIDKLLNGSLVGPCGELPIAAGDKIVIPKGTAYTTTYRKKGDEKGDGKMVTKRAYTVVVRRVCDGYYSSKVHNPKVTWAGTGGYWCEAEMQYVRKAAPTPTRVNSSE